MAVSRYDVLKAYVVSKERGTAVGIRLKGSDNVLITTISQVTGRSDEDTHLRLNDRSIYGDPVTTRSVALAEVEHIGNMRISFDDPLYVHLRTVRNKVRNIRTSMAPRAISVSR